MPWIDEERCTACGICVDECPVGTITLPEGEKAFIVEEDCIRCGKCHEVCPSDAVRHDKDRIPLDVDANVTWTRDTLSHYESDPEKIAFLQRTVRYYEKQSTVAERTIGRVQELLEELRERQPT